MGKYSVNKYPSDVMHDLANRFRKLRKRNKFSRSELSARSGVSESSIKRFELSGRISLESLLKITHLVDRLSDFEQVFRISERDKSIEKLFSDKTKRK